jgi:chromosome segregation ATPase
MKELLGAKTPSTSPNVCSSLVAIANETREIKATFEDNVRNVFGDAIQSLSTQLNDNVGVVGVLDTNLRQLTNTVGTMTRDYAEAMKNIDNGIVTKIDNYVNEQDFSKRLNLVCQTIVEVLVNQSTASLSKNLNDLATKLEDIPESVSDKLQQIQQNEALIMELQQGMQQNDARITGLQQSMQQNDVLITWLQQNDALITGLQQNESLITGLQQGIQQNDTRITGLQQDVQALADEMHGFKDEEYDGQLLNVQSLERDVQELGGQISSLTEQCKSYEESAQENQAKNDELFEDVIQTLNVLASRQTTINQNITDLYAQITKINSSIVSLVDSINKINAELFAFPNFELTSPK